VFAREGEGDEGPAGEVSSSELLRMQQKSLPSDATRLRSACHCGAIELRIARPDDTSASASASGLETRGETESKARSMSKFSAHISACRVDGLSSGAWGFQPWAAVPLGNMAFLFADGDIALSQVLASAFARRPEPNSDLPRPVSEIMSKMTVFSVTAQTRLAFCNTCGASLFRWSDDRPDVIDVAVGILRADEGCLARDWLDWSWEVVGAEEAIDPAMLEALRNDR